MCKRCQVSGHTCVGYDDSHPEGAASTKRWRVIPQFSPLTIYQPEAAVSPAQVNASRQELELFHYYRTQVTEQSVDEFNRSLWTLHILQAARSQPSIWHACNAMAALHQRHHESAAAGMTTERKGHLYSVALQQYTMSLRHVIDLTQLDHVLTYRDKSTILAANLLFVACCVEREELAECFIHLNNGLKLIHQWKFWEPPSRPTTISSMPWQTEDTELPYIPILLFYVQLDGLVHEDSPSLTTWRWGLALLSLQTRPLTSVPDACLEMEMIWIGARDIFTPKESVPDPHLPCTIMSQLHDVMGNYFRNWTARFYNLRHSTQDAQESDKVLMTILEMRHIILGIMLSTDTDSLDLCWYVLERQFERAMSLITGLLGENNGDNENETCQFDETCMSGEKERTSYTPSLTRSLQFLARVCLQPSLRRRAISLLKVKNRTHAGDEGMDVTFVKQSAEAIAELETGGWYTGQSEGNSPEDSFLAGSFICNGHRVFDFRINGAGVDTGQVKLRTVHNAVEEISDSRAPQSLAMSNLARQWKVETLKGYSDQGTGGFVFCLGSQVYWLAIE